MSRVYFHSEAGEAELRGSERAHCGVTISHIALALLSISDFDDDFIVQLVPEGHYIRRSDRVAESLRTAFAVGDFKFSLPDGRTADAFTVTLNTVIVAGDDVLRLMARLHGQCELHGYVEGPNRAWLADLMARGIDEHLFRPKQGWEDVIALLRAAADQPVVTSYSVCDSFPNPGIVGLTDEKKSEAWYELPVAQQWRQALKVLRAEPRRGLEWRPDNWADIRFGNGITAMEIRAIANSLVVPVTETP
jgi:hypothetical protein